MAAWSQQEWTSVRLPGASIDAEPDPRDAAGYIGGIESNGDVGDVPGVRADGPEQTGRGHRRRRVDREGFRMGRFQISGAVRGIIVEDPSAIPQDEGPGVHGPRSSVQSIEDLRDAAVPVGGIQRHRDGRYVPSICPVRAGGRGRCDRCDCVDADRRRVRWLHESGGILGEVLEDILAIRQDEGPLIHEPGAVVESIRDLSDAARGVGGVERDRYVGPIPSVVANRSLQYRGAHGRRGVHEDAYGSVDLPVTGQVRRTEPEDMPTFSKGHGTSVGHPRSAVEPIHAGRAPACHVRRRARGGYPGYVPAVRSLRAGEADRAQRWTRIDRDAAGVDRLQAPGLTTRPASPQVPSLA